LNPNPQFRTGEIGSTCPIRSGHRTAAEYQSDDKEEEKNIKENFGNGSGGTGNASES
jgi:hypothetical protein